jgi:hypothetical protein
MKRTIAVCSIASLATLVLLGATPGGAQEPNPQTQPQPKPRAEDPKKMPMGAYRVDISINELEDGKKVNARQYSMNLRGDDRNQLSIGTQVPVEKEEGKFEYMDVGTEVYCQLLETAEGLALQVRASISHIGGAPEQIGRHPVVRRFKIAGSGLLQPGKPLSLGSVDDPNSKRQFQLEATVTRLR